MAKETTLFQKFSETAKHGIIFGLGYSLQTALGLVLLPFYTSHLSTTEYGELGVISTTAGVLTIIFTLGINLGLFRSYFDYKDAQSQKRVITTGFLMLALNNIGLLAVAILFSTYFSQILFGDPSFGFYFEIAIINAIFAIFNTIPFLIFRSKKKSGVFISSQLGFFLIGIALNIYFIASLKMGILGILTSQLITNVATFFVLYFYIRHEFTRSFWVMEAKKMLAYGAPMVIANLSVFVFEASDQYFLNHYSSLHEVGLYNLAYKFGLVLIVAFAQPVGLIWGPMYLSVKDDKNSGEFFRKAITYATLISFFIFLAVSLLAKEVIQLFTTENFWNAYLAVPLIVMTYAMWGIRKVVNVGILVKRKTKFAAKLFFTGAVMNVILNFLLIPGFGMMGAAFATVSTYALMMIALLLYNQHLLELKLEWNRLFKLSALTLLLFSAAFFYPTDSIFFAILIKTIAIVSFPLLLFVLQFFEPDELDKLRELRDKAKTFLRRKQPQEVESN